MGSSSDSVEREVLFKRMLPAVYKLRTNAHPMGSRGDYILILGVRNVDRATKLWCYINLFTGERGEHRTTNWGVPEHLSQYFARVT